MIEIRVTGSEVRGLLCRGCAEQQQIGTSSFLPGLLWQINARRARDLPTKCSTNKEAEEMVSPTSPSKPHRHQGAVRKPQLQTSLHHHHQPFIHSNFSPSAMGCRPSMNCVMADTVGSAEREMGSAEARASDRECSAEARAVLES